MTIRRVFLDRLPDEGYLSCKIKVITLDICVKKLGSGLELGSELAKISIWRYTMLGDTLINERIWNREELCLLSQYLVNSDL